jgi:hypothetical protein
MIAQKSYNRTQRGMVGLGVSEPTRSERGIAG